MKNKNIKVIDEHNIDRNANIMFAVDLNGSEYVVYWIERDETSNNVFVSKVLKNLDGTYNMLNIDDADKKRDVSEAVKYLVSSAVSDQNDKLAGLTKTLSNGETAKFISVSFNKEQNINVPKTYITTVKKEVTKVVEDYYDVISNENEIETVLTPVNTVAPTPVVVPEVVETITNEPVPVVEEVKIETSEPVVATPEVATPVVETPVVPTPVLPAVEEVQPIPVVNVAEPVMTVPTPVQTQPEPIAATPVVATPVVETPVVSTPTPVLPTVEEVKPASVVAMPEVAATTVETPVVPTPEMTIVSSPATAPVLSETIPVQSVPVQQPLLQPEPIAATPVVAASVVETPVVPTPVASTPIVNTTPAVEQPLVFNAAKETNLNAALGEVANSNNVPVENINAVREFGEETPVVQNVVPPAVAPMVQSTSAVEPKMLVKKAGFANSKFFMVVAVAFFMASCVFLGYEVFNYFQITTK